MNRTELVDAIAVKADISKKDADAAVKAFIEVVSDELQNKGKVQLVGFGTFETSERAARTGRNPQTQELVPAAVHHHLDGLTGSDIRGIEAVLLRVLPERR